MRRLMVKTLALVAALTALAPAAQAEIRLGVIAPRGEAQATAQWGEFARYVEQKIGEPVKLMPVVLARLAEVIQNKDVDYALCNPVQAIAVSERDGLSLLASLVLPTGAEFGGVILANPKAGITTAADIKGKKVIGLTQKSAGGYLFQAYYLNRAGVNVPGDFASYQTAKKHDDAVLAVKAGLMDAGFVRTGVLEAMIAEGKLKDGDVIVVDPKPGYPQAVTTQLYPEWYLVDVKGDTATAGKVKDAVLSLPKDSPAATTAGIDGFSEPVPPGQLIEMMKAMKVPPFDGT